MLSELWDNRTELEKGLILILIFLVPFLLLLCGLYIHLGLMKANINEKYVGQQHDSNAGGTKPIKEPGTPEPPKEETRNVDDTNAKKTYKKRSIPICDCSILRNIFEPQLFISSISETVFEDDPNEFKLKCSAVVLTERYILTFLNCLSKNLTLKIRSSSTYWSKGGYIRQVSYFVNVNNSLVVVKLATPLSNYEPMINMVEISNDESLKSIIQFDLYRWNSKFTSDLNRRIKYGKLNKVRLNVTKCTNNNRDFNGFCALEINESASNEDLDDRDPIFEIDSNKLIGMEVQRVIFKDMIEHYYIFIRNSDIEMYISNKIDLFQTYI